MSSPNSSLSYSTSPSSSGGAAAAAAAAAAAGRKRQLPSTPVYSPNETLNQMTQEAEARQQDKYIVQKEIRAIRAQEMEKQRKEDEEKEKEEQNSRFTSQSRSNSVSSTSTITNGSSSYLTKHRLQSTSRQTEDTVIDSDNPRELKKKLAELEEKYTKHALYQTQFENDNQKLVYEVENLKDLIEEHEELIVELRRQFKDKARELDNQKRSNKDLQTDFIRLKEILKQRDALIQESGLILYTDNELQAKELAKKSIDLTDSNDIIKSVLPAALVSSETARLLDILGEGTIDDKLRKLLDTKQDLKEQNNRLRSELDDERQKIESLERRLASNQSKMLDKQETANELHELQRQYTKEINDFKIKNQKLEHENIVMKQDIQRLETQLKYMKTNFDELEQSEQRLNKEKREAQRELKESKNLIKELQNRIDRLEISQKISEKKRLLSKFVDITSACTSSLSITSSNSATSLPQNLFINSSSTEQSLSSSTNSDLPSANEQDERDNQRQKLDEKTNTVDKVQSSSSQSNAININQEMSYSSSTVTTELSLSPTLSSGCSNNNSSSSSSASSSSTTSPSQHIQEEKQSEFNTNNDTLINTTPNTTKTRKPSKEISEDIAASLDI